MNDILFMSRQCIDPVGPRSEVIHSPPRPALRRALAHLSTPKPLLRFPKSLPILQPHLEFHSPPSEPTLHCTHSHTARVHITAAPFSSSPNLKTSHRRGTGWRLTFAGRGVELLADLLYASVAVDLGDTLAAPELHELSELLEGKPVLGRSAVDGRHDCVSSSVGRSVLRSPRRRRAQTAALLLLLMLRAD